MKKKFCIEAGDAGSEAYRDEYVKSLETAARAFQAIWLRKEGEHHFIVAIEVNPGKWVDVIREFDGGGGMSHIVESRGIQRCVDLASGIDDRVTP